MNTVTPIATDTSPDAMKALLDRQRASFLREGPPSIETRIDRIDRVIALLVDHKDAIAAALSEDFGSRSVEASLLLDVFTCVGSLKYAKAHLAEWLKPEQHEALFPDAVAEVVYQPKGVVGILSPWNFPYQLALAPLAGILAAGNRAMIKPSEVTPASSALMAELTAGSFDETEISVVQGGPATGTAFTSLAFDHLIFTGGTAIAHHVMRAAAENLTPLTLELGGKSPVIVGRAADLADAARRVMTVKTLNAGQICLAPDYVYVPEESVEAFAGHAVAAVGAMYPTLKENPDYTSIVNARHLDRVQGLIDDARAKGARVVEINPAAENFSQQSAHRVPPTLILDPTEDMRVLQEEIFGPVLPVLPYRDIADVIDRINARPRPLALYYFSQDQQEERRVLDNTTSGGVTVNDCMSHVTAEGLPFGGVGHSGMGAYHGKFGFLAFSHPRAVYHQSRMVEAEYMMRPPYGEAMRGFLTAAICK
ncbi:coniferyl aldehyde dehydrogenase [Rhizobium leguminosarum]